MRHVILNVLLLFVSLSSYADPSVASIGLAFPNYIQPFDQIPHGTLFYTPSSYMPQFHTIPSYTSPVYFPPSNSTPEYIPEFETTVITNLTPSMDAFVSTVSNTTNFDLGYLVIWNQTTDCQPTYYLCEEFTYMKWDVPFTFINSANLWLYQIASRGGTYDVYVHSVTEPWTESGITYNNRSAIEPEPETIKELSSAFDWQFFSIVNISRAWADGSKPNYGVRISAPADHLEKNFYSKESFTEERPYLELNRSVLSYTRGADYVNYTWIETLSGNKTDSWNISVNNVWNNGSLDNFINISVNEGDWANITVFAFNSSGHGALSQNSVSGNVKLDARAGKYIPSSFSEVAMLTTSGGALNDGHFHTVKIDKDDNYAYFPTYISSGTGSKIYKIDLHSFTEVANITTQNYEGGLYTSMIDKDSTFLYVFGDNRRVMKIRLSNFSEVSTLVTSAEAYDTAVIDKNSRFMYLGTYGSVHKIIKIDLINFSEVGSIATSEGSFAASVIDKDSEFAYFGIFANPGKIVKVNLTSFTEDANITTSGSYLISAVIDKDSNYAYFGTDTQPAKIVKLNLTDFSEESVLNASRGNLRSVVIDKNSDYAYFTSYTIGISGNILKVRLSDLTEESALATNLDHLWSTAIDSASNYLYSGTDTDPAKIVKINLPTT